MRIENIGPTKNVQDRAYEKGLMQGDVLIAEVTEIMGETVVLKSQGRPELSARMLVDIGVAVGDFVETVVDEADGGRYVLRIVDIARNYKDADTQQNRTDVPAARYAVNAQMLLDTLTMLKSKPGVDPKAAAFLSRHGLSTENLPALAALSKGGETAGKLLAEVVAVLGTAALPGDTVSATFAEAPDVKTLADSAALPVTQVKDAVVAQTTEPVVTDQAQTRTEDANNVNNAKAPVSAENVPLGEDIPAASQLVQSLPHQAKGAALPADNAQTQPVTQAAQGADAAQPAQPPADTLASGPPAVAGQAAQPEIAPGMEAAAPVAKNETAGAPEAAVNRGLEKPAANPDVQMSASLPAENMARQQAVQSAVARAMLLFVRLDEKDSLGPQIKKAVKQLSAELKELKLLVERTDTMNKDMAAGKLEPLEKQLSLMAQLKRFDCFHIPLLAQDGTPSTAELYVYRYRKKKAQNSGDDTVILLGLDTQHMGRVETLVKASGSSLDIKLHLEDMRLAEGIASDADLLKDAADRLGYRQVRVSVEKLMSRTTLLTAEERLASHADGRAGNVDIRI